MSQLAQFMQFHGKILLLLFVFLNAIIVSSLFPIRPVCLRTGTMLRIKVMWGYSHCRPTQRCHQEIDLILLGLVYGMELEQNAGLDFVTPVIE